jgi:hypothetical protein
MIAYPQDAPISGTESRFSKSWQRFLLALRNQVGDSTPFTPVVSSKTGALSSASATSIYQKIGDQVCWSVSVNITNNGTGSNAIVVTLPITTYGIINGCGVHTNSGLMLLCQDSFPRPVGAPATAIAIYRYDGSYPLGTDTSGVLHLHVVYQITSTVMN